MSRPKYFTYFYSIKLKTTKKTIEIHLQPRITETECTVYQLIVICKWNKKGSKLSREEVVFKTSEKQISWRNR